MYDILYIVAMLSNVVAKAYHCLGSYTLFGSRLKYGSTLYYVI